MYAIVGASRLKPGATPDVTKNILNGLSQAPGFVSGTIAWSTDGERGHSMAVFETEEAAKNAMDLALSNMPADAPLEIDSIEVCEVVARA